VGCFDRIGRRRRRAAEELGCLLDRWEAAKLLDVSPKRVHLLGIPYVRLSERGIRFNPLDIANWLRAKSRAA
jgi:hypothetical protein